MLQVRLLILVATINLHNQNFARCKQVIFVAGKTFLMLKISTNDNLPEISMIFAAIHCVYDASFQIENYLPQEYSQKPLKEASIFPEYSSEKQFFSSRTGCVQ